MSSLQHQQADMEPQQRAQQLLNEQAPQDHQLAEADTITTWLTTSADEKVQLNWTNTGPTGRWDYVALFDANPQTVGAHGYLRNQWQYTADHKSPYTTGTNAGQGKAYWIGYCAWDYASKQYVVVESSGPSEP